MSMIGENTSMRLMGALMLFATSLCFAQDSGDFNPLHRMS